MTASLQVILTSAVVAAGVSGVLSLVALTVNLAVSGARERKARKRDTFAKALEAVVAYTEFPFVVRRRRASDPEGERIRISEDLRKVQHDLAYFTAWMATESPQVRVKYEALVADMRRVIGAEISKAWDIDPITRDNSMHMPDIGLSQLKPAKLAYLDAVVAYLEPWWKKRVW